MVRFKSKYLIVPIALGLVGVAVHVRSDASATSAASTEATAQQDMQHDAQHGQHMQAMHEHMKEVSEALAAHLGLGPEGVAAIQAFFDSLHSSRMGGAHHGSGDGHAGVQGAGHGSAHMMHGAMRGAHGGTGRGGGG